MEWASIGTSIDLIDDDTFRQLVSDVIYWTLTPLPPSPIPSPEGHDHPALNYNLSLSDNSKLIPSRGFDDHGFYSNTVWYEVLRYQIPTNQQLKTFLF